MKFSWNWLTEWLSLQWSADELAERLTMAGIEVEGIESRDQNLDKVIVVQILKSEKHPNADRLSVCEVNTGSSTRQIVCGAKNYQVGDKVPLALPGACLPNGMEVKRSKLRGIDSDGMLCSPKELGLAEEAQGLLILDKSSKTGQPLAQALGFNDTIFDLEITPNRPDLLSHWGLAREIAALADLPPLDLRDLLSEDDEKRFSAVSLPLSRIPIRVEDPIRCSRYTARVIRGVKIGPSPPWLRNRLENLGHRSISNVVDITNYVLYEVGQPLHTFDLNRLKGPGIIVRLAYPGEKLIRLDEETSELEGNMLIIADMKRPVALAGIIGGKETAVSEMTTDILLESATFQPASVRKTSKMLGISTDSSYRFERGVDSELAAWASLRATALILQICGGEVEGSLVDICSQSPAKRKIPYRHSRVRSLLGTSISQEKATSVLKRLGCTFDSDKVEPPSYRLDLEREVDLIEEIARMDGVEHIPALLRPIPLLTDRDSSSFVFARRLRAIATALGLDEASHYTVISSADLREIYQEAPKESLLLANPLSSEMDALRPSLFMGLLTTCARNIAAGNERVTLFELGNVFQIQKGSLIERSSMGIVLAGERCGKASWEKGIQKTSYDFYDLKGKIDTLLESLGLVHIQCQEASSTETPMLEPGVSFVFTHDHQIIGCVGRVHDRLACREKLPMAVYYAELDVEWLSAFQPTIHRYRPWTIYPTIRRDIALTVPVKVKYQYISESLNRLAKKHTESKGIFLQQIEIFDTFQSVRMGTDKKSMAYSMIYQSPSRTLTDQEINKIHEAVKRDLKNEILCEIRE